MVYIRLWPTSYTTQCKAGLSSPPKTMQCCWSPTPTPCAAVMRLFTCRVGQNHIYTVHIRYFFRGGTLRPKMGILFACS